KKTSKIGLQPKCPISFSLAGITSQKAPPRSAGRMLHHPSRSDMFDHVYLNGISTHGNKVNLAIQGDRYADIGPDIIPSPGTATTDLEGRLVLPGFVDGHIHLAKSFV